MREEAGHDGVLLMDRVMSTSLQLAPDLLDLLAVGCVVIAAKQVDSPAPPGTAELAPALPADADLAAASGLPRAAIDQMEWNIRQVLAQVRAKTPLVQAEGGGSNQAGWLLASRGNCEQPVHKRALMLTLCCSPHSPPPTLSRTLPPSPRCAA